jgi:hypothetical protein
MTKIILKASLFAAFAGALAVSTAAQDQGVRSSQRRPAGPAQTSSSVSPARVPVIIVGSAARVTWATAKFTTKHLAGPLAKMVFVRATPAITKFALKRGLPYAAKLSLL